MYGIILYLTPNDSELIRKWINDQVNIYWIIKTGQSDCTYMWKAVHTIDAYDQTEYYLWNKKSKPLFVPSGCIHKKDKKVRNPRKGWIQTLNYSNAQKPWFGGNLPEPVCLSLKYEGSEQENSLGRSGFHWVGNYYRSIGKAASKASEQWWKDVYKFVKKNSKSIPWPNTSLSEGRKGAYAFPDAYGQMLRGRPRDMNS